MKADEKQIRELLSDMDDAMSLLAFIRRQINRCISPIEEDFTQYDVQLKKADTRIDDAMRDMRMAGNGIRDILEEL